MGLVLFEKGGLVMLRKWQDKLEYFLWRWTTRRAIKKSNVFSASCMKCRQPIAPGDYVLVEHPVCADVVHSPRYYHVGRHHSLAGPSHLCKALAAGGDYWHWNGEELCHIGDRATTLQHSKEHGGNLRGYDEI